MSRVRVIHARRVLYLEQRNFKLRSVVRHVFPFSIFKTVVDHYSGRDFTGVGKFSKRGVANGWCFGLPVGAGVIRRDWA